MRILVPRLADASQINAQNLNAKAILAHAGGRDVQWVVAHYGEPDVTLRNLAHVELAPLRQGRLWPWHIGAMYQRSADAIFYPGAEWFDTAALRLRSACGRSIPMIATMEGLPGDSAREHEAAIVSGHTVHCHRVNARILNRIDSIFTRAAHIVAISPFLGRIASYLYGTKVSVLPFGYDERAFHARGRRSPRRSRVVCAAGLRSHKRPEVFVALAEAFPDADFIWYGAGDPGSIPGLNPHRRQKNLSFPGAVTQQQLAEAMRNADILVLPSLSEGVPKITMEAAACGLAQIVFGHYEAPTVAEGRNGHVVWTDEELKTKLGGLLSNGALRRKMGDSGIEMARDWTWSRLAPMWQDHITRLVREAKRGNLRR